MLYWPQQRSPSRSGCDDPNRLHVLSAPSVVLKADLPLRLHGQRINAALDFGAVLHQRDDAGKQPAADSR